MLPPDGCSAISISGVEIQNVDGVFMIPTHFEEQAKEHGFIRFVEKTEFTDDQPKKRKF